MCILLILCASTKLARRQGGSQVDVEMSRCFTFSWNFNENKYQYL